MLETSSASSAALERIGRPTCQAVCDCGSRRSCAHRKNSATGRDEQPCSATLQPSKSSKRFLVTPLDARPSCSCRKCMQKSDLTTHQPFERLLGRIDGDPRAHRRDLLFRNGTCWCTRDTTASCRPLVRSTAWRSPATSRAGGEWMMRSCKKLPV